MAARRETAIGEQPLRGALRLQAFLEDGMRIERGLARCDVRGERETRLIVLELEDRSFQTPDRHIHRPLTDRGTDTGINRLIRRHARVDQHAHPTDQPEKCHHRPRSNCHRCPAT